ncbi:hypothetical protein P7C73_g3380, partial [Tremellales sp. Uapishka_1]
MADTSIAPIASQVGLSYKEIAQTLASFLEVALHTLLCIRQVYPPSTFTRRRAHSVPVYQSRHPQVREYVSEVCALIGKEMLQANVSRVTVVIKAVDTGLPLERFIIDLGYGEGLWKQGPQSEIGLSDDGGAIAAAQRVLDQISGTGWSARGQSRYFSPGGHPSASDVESRRDNFCDPGRDQRRPGAQYESSIGRLPPWVPAMSGDVLKPAESQTLPCKHEPLLHVKAVETGVIDLRLMVQECVAKTGEENLIVQ